MDNIQTFTQESSQYARYRPHYPDDLFEFLAGESKDHVLSWDCASGTGQAAQSCAQYFDRVIATDISMEQILNSEAHSQIQYLVMAAEQSAFQDSSFDLITVAQAIHWFDQQAFFHEVGRVLKPEGMLAVWGYGFPEITPEIDQTISQYLGKPIDRFWMEGNRQLMSGYRDLVLPFNTVDIPHPFSIDMEWNLPSLLEYFRTWSAVKRCRNETGFDPVVHLEKKLLPVWTDPQTMKRIKMPLFVKIGRK